MSEIYETAKSHNVEGTLSADGLEDYVHAQMATESPQETIVEGSSCDFTNRLFGLEEQEIFGFPGTDSTAVIRVSSEIAEPDDEETQTATDWLSEAASTQNKVGTLQNGIHVVKGLVDLIGFKINLANKTIAEKAIILGKVCNQLKILNRGSKTPWAVWAEENLPFLNVRNRQKYMAIASRPDCHPYAFLGVDRLDVLCSLTKAFLKECPEENAIEALFIKYQIPFDQPEDLEMSEFRDQIDKAIAAERLERNGFEIDFETVAKAIDAGATVDKTLIKRLTDIKKCGGDPKALMERLAEGDDDDPEEEKEKHLKDFNSLSTRLVVTVDYLLESPDEFERMDRAIFESLMAKLSRVKDLMADFNAE
jgi:hypothetical protein